MTTKYLDVPIGAALRDCCPENSERVIIVDEVTPHHVFGWPRGNGPCTSVPRCLIHDNPRRRTGYFLEPPK